MALGPLSHSDVCFVVGRERQEVFAHRCLLACRCNFFRRLLGPGVPSPVELSTVPAEAFLAVLEFLYTNSVKLQRHSVSLPCWGGVRERLGVPEAGVCSLRRGLRGGGELPQLPHQPPHAGAGGTDSSCGIWTGGTSRGGCLGLAIWFLLPFGSQSPPHSLTFSHRAKCDSSLCARDLHMLSVS